MLLLKLTYLLNRPERVSFSFAYERIFIFRSNSHTELYNIETVSMKEIQSNQRNAQQILTCISDNFAFETFLIIRQRCVIYTV